MLAFQVEHTFLRSSKLIFKMSLSLIIIIPLACVKLDHFTSGIFKRLATSLDLITFVFNHTLY